MINVPESPQTYFTTYAGLKGVDYSVSPVEVTRSRAADILNMIPKNGNPVKRKGWRQDYDFQSEVVSAYHDPYQNVDYISTKNNGTYVYANYAYVKATSLSNLNIIPFNGKIYLFPRDGETVHEVKYTPGSVSVGSVQPTIPWTIYGLNPNGTSGTAYYGVNAFTTRRQISYVGDSGTIYRPHPDGATGFATVIEKVEILDDMTGKWVETQDYTAHVSGQVTALDKDMQQQTVNIHDYLTFTTAHPSSRQQDNIRLTIRELDTEHYSPTVLWGDYCRLGRKIKNSDIFAQYGAVNMDRIFAVVDGNKVYYSDASDIMYFPDDNYVVAGSSSPIMGLTRKDSYLVAVTGDSPNHSVYMIKSGTAVITESVTDESGRATSVAKEQQYFSVRPATSGKGAIAKGAFCTLIDDPLFLSSTGVFCITSNALNTATLLAQKSTYINPRLTKEPNLKDAVACIWKDYYIVCVNGHCYVLDSKMVTKDTANNRCYECYYWENVPAVKFLAYGEHLFFAKADGKWCRFNTDVEGDPAYCDDGTWVDEGDELEYVEGTGTPVTARYTTILDDDGRPQYYKTMHKKGAVCTLVQQTASSVDIYYSKDGAPNVLFSNVVPQTTDTREIDVYPLKKVKKYRRLSLTFENSKMQPFGLIKFIKAYSLGNYSKR